MLYCRDPSPGRIVYYRRLSCKEPGELKLQPRRQCEKRRDVGPGPHRWLRSRRQRLVRGQWAQAGKGSSAERTDRRSGSSCSLEKLQTKLTNKMKKQTGYAYGFAMIRQWSTIRCTMEEQRRAEQSEGSMTDEWRVKAMSSAGRFQLVMRSMKLLHVSQPNRFFGG